MVRPSVSTSADDNARQVLTRARTKPLSPQAKTIAAKATFLKAFRTVGIISPAARAAGIARQTIYVWQELDDEFAAAFNAAREEAIDALEAEAWRRAVDGDKQERPLLYRGEQVGVYTVVERSDRLLELLLKAGRPERFRERIDMKHSGSGPLIKALASADLELLEIQND